MNRYATIQPGSRVRAPGGFIGTVEALSATSPRSPADVMIVRSDDSARRYAIPLARVRHVTQDTPAPIVDVSLQPQELPSLLVAPAQGSTRQPPLTPDEGQAMQIPVAQEQLVAHKRPHVRGTVRVHKDVQSREAHLSVPVTHEEAIVERIPADAYDGRPPESPDEVLIPVLEERLVVQKQTVVKEYLRVRKVRVTDQQEVHDTLRHEVVSLSEQRNPVAGDHAPLLREAGTGEAAEASPAG